MTELDWEGMKRAVTAQIGQPYLFGAKPKISEYPCGPTDCSGFVVWAFGQVHIKVPDGSQNQYDKSIPIDLKDAKPGDLGFFSKDGHIDHVGIVYDDTTMIEARGNPYNQVIFRPRVKWENWPGFAGYRRVV